MKRMTSPTFGSVTWSNLEFFGPAGELWGDLLDKASSDRSAETHAKLARLPKSKMRARCGALGMPKRRSLAARRARARLQNP